MPRVEVTLPDFGLPDKAVRLTVWHVARGSHLRRGEPILEVTAGAVTIDLLSPSSGLLAERLAAEDDLVALGDPVAIIDTEE